MSASASIDISVAGNNVSAIEIIQVLMNSGWTLVHNGYINYLPLGNKDDFDWQANKDINIEELNQILQAKKEQKEIIGVRMTWQNTDIGGDFLFWPKNNNVNSLETFSLNFDGNRQKIKMENNYELTDFQWYLSKLLPQLSKILKIEYVSFDHYI